MTKKRRRPIHLHVMVSEEEQTLIQDRMAEAGIRNMGAYVRKMALNGYVLHVDLAPVRELVSLQRRCANNLNQVAIHANTYGVYPEEIAALQKDYAAGSRCLIFWKNWRRWWKCSIMGSGEGRSPDFLLMEHISKGTKDCLPKANWLFRFSCQLFV